MITLAIPTYNRVDSIIKNIELVNEQKIIDEIIIFDDSSIEEIYNDLFLKIKTFNSNKIKLFRNSENQKAFKNKYNCVKESKNDWVILLDSDNFLTKDYINSIPHKLDNNTFYLPSRAICDSKFLDYTEYIDKIFEKKDFISFLSKNDIKIDCLFNTGNFLVNKKIYTESFESENNKIEPFGVDVVYQIFLCFKNSPNFKLEVIKDMVYYHTLHTNNNKIGGSFYTDTVIKNKEILKEIKIQALSL